MEKRTSGEPDGLGKSAPEKRKTEQNSVSAVAGKRLRRRDSAYTPSIKEALSGHYQDDSAAPGTDVVNDSYLSENQLNESFTQEQFEEKWKSYIAQLKHRPNLKVTLTNRVPRLTDETNLVMMIDNSVQEAEIGSIKPGLVSWLRQELRNTAIELVTKISLQKVDSKPYSETEKLNEMVRKNPAINLLRQKFNLDFGE